MYAVPNIVLFPRQPTAAMAPAWVAIWFLALGCSPSKPTASPGTKRAEPATDEATPKEPSQNAQDVPELSLEDVLKQCGVSASELENPDSILIEKTIRSWPKTFTGTQAAPIVGDVNYRVTITTVISIKASLSEVEQNVDFEIEAVPSKAETPARERVAPNRGSSISTVLSTEERMALVEKNRDWEGVLCTIQPVKELSTNKGGLGKVVTFDPPLPGSISPKADPARYAAEIGSGRTFHNIKARVIGSTDPAVPEGKEYTGSVRITPVTPTLTLDIGGKSTKTIKADAAYKIEWNFGSTNDTVAIGLMPMQTMLFDHGKRDISAIVADTGFEEGGTIVLLDGI